MWIYEKKLEYPVKIKNPNPALARVIISQLGGPDGEVGAATRYLQQRYTMPLGQVKGMLTDIGTEELAHIEMISAILYQLTRNLSMDDIKRSGFDTYFVDHTTAAYPQAASGVPFSAGSLQVTGDALADIYEDLAAEQKARLSYDNILRLIDDPDVRDPITFLREREIVHFQRFGDALRLTQDSLDAKNFYAFNPSFDKCCNPPDPICSKPAGDCVCAQPLPAMEPACGCAPAPVPHCGCTPAPAPHCGCMPAPVPHCGCTPAPAPHCGCAPAPAPHCGCAAPAPMPTPSCGCAAPMPHCGCQSPCGPYFKQSKRGRYIG